MSLHDLANHVQSAGRGEDKVLVHMTPGEVNGLQSLAMAHGGSLTTNPETGLPEAGFLSSLLPMAIGFGLAPFTGGLSAALITGAGYTAATGSLKKGIMAGLGAYGGAGLAGGLSSLGASTTSAANASAAAAQTPALNVATFNPATGTAMGVEGLKANMYGTGQGIFSTTPAAASVTPGATSAAASLKAFPSYVPAGPSPVNLTAMQQNAAAAQLKSLPTQATLADAGQVVSQSPFNQIGAGFERATGNGLQGLEDLYTAMPKNSITAGISGTLGAYQEEKREEALKEMRKRNAAQRTGMIRPYEFSYGATGVDQEPYTDSAERTYFQPTYTALTPYKAPGPEYAAEGGIMGLAVGGAVEDMAAGNAIGANTGYPMAYMQTPMYSDPSMQRPHAVNVVAPSADMGVDTYTGEAQFAKGGDTGTRSITNWNEGGGRGVGGNSDASSKTTGGYSYTYDPVTMQFTQMGKPKPVATGRIGSYNNPSGIVAADMSMPANGTVSGGMVSPVMQPMSSGQSFVPNINIPAYQTPDQQMGLGSFYEDMNRTFGGYKGYAAGGRTAPMNAKMAAVDAARAKMQTRQGQMEMAKAARDGDYSAQLALQDAGYDLNELNNYAGGGISHLGDYSDGGRLLKGPGDGVSDSIPASIGNRQPARLADGEFVVPARIVSEIGNGSTEAGARKLYAMMDRVQRARRNTVGKGQVAKNTKAEKLLPA